MKLKDAFIISAWITLIACFGIVVLLLAIALVMAAIKVHAVLGIAIGAFLLWQILAIWLYIFDDRYPLP